MPNTLTIQQINKLGNSLIYLSKKVNELNKTKILKLLFLLEEASIKKFGYPFFGIDFQLWKHGPVFKEAFIDLSEDSPILLKNYIKKADYNPAEFIAAKEFSDDEFSDNDIYLMDTVANFARSKNARDLVEYTHGENSLWRKSAIKKGILEQLEKETVNNTNYNIDFSLLFDDDDIVKEKYQSAVENMEFMRHLKK